MTDSPRIFMLGNPGWEETLEQYERRNGEPFDPAWEAKATEIAPGTRVLQLSEGGGIGPDGQRASFGARIAVWHDNEDGCE
jgi:hypothetical protein